jgi:hypothetical protein
VKRYVSEVLAPQPVLAALVSSDGHAWTTNGMVDGAVNLNRDDWEWLKTQDRHAPTVVGSPADAEVYYLSSALTATQATLATDAPTDVDLRVGAPVNIGWRLPLQPEWEVRLWYDRAEVPEDRPFARVVIVGALGLAGPSLYYEVTQPLSIECSPLAPETADEAVTQALVVQDTLVDGFRGHGVGVGKPLRIPLYNYDGVALTESAAERHPSDFLRVVDFSPRLMADPMDPRRVGVIVDLRVSWRKDNELGELGVRGTRVVQDVQVTEQMT